MVFMVPLVVALLLVTPRQPSAALGIEIIILGAVHGLGLAMIGRVKRESGTEPNSHLARLVAVITPNSLTTALVLAGGAALLAGHASGLYFLVAAVVIALIGGVANAWLFLILDRDQTTES
jgi:modulator of FtsH protease